MNNIFQLNLAVYGKYKTRKIETTKKPSLKYSKSKKRKKPIIKIKSKDWSEKDVEYLSPLDITKLNWIPIQFYWIDEQRFNTSELAYAFRYDINVYKIYQPLLETHKGKWWTNISVENQWYGHDLLNYEDPVLFICSSNKDATVLYQLGCNAIAPHTEAQIFNQEQYDYYSSKFSRIIIFYDNDDAGIKYAEKFSQTWNLEYIYLEEVDTKDPFAFIKKYNLEDLNLWLQEIL